MTFHFLNRYLPDAVAIIGTMDLVSITYHIYIDKQRHYRCDHNACALIHTYSISLLYTGVRRSRSIKESLLRRGQQRRESDISASCFDESEWIRTFICIVIPFHTKISSSDMAVSMDWGVQ